MTATGLERACRSKSLADADAVAVAVVAAPAAEIIMTGAHRHCASATAITGSRQEGAHAMAHAATARGPKTCLGRRCTCSRSTSASRPTATACAT